MEPNLPHDPHTHPHHGERLLEIVYNGLTKPVTAKPTEPVSAVVQAAASLFGITQNVHTLALFREDGTEVPVDKTVAEAGLKNGELLALRPSAVRGG